MRIAIVTGASSGMGREFVYAIDREFAPDEIWAIARREERLAELSENCRAVIRPIPLDLGKRESYETLRLMLEKETPDVQILVNGAGYGVFGSFTATDLDEQLGIIDLNEKALTAVCHITLPYMKSGSHLVNICSNSSWQPVPFINVYGSTKAYALNFTRALDWELRCQKRGIHVMAVCPGWIKTEFFDRAVRDDTIVYYDRYYTARQVIDRAMRDLKKKKQISIMGLPVRMQVRLVKFAPVNFVMKTWCRQQKKL